MSIGSILIFHYHAALELMTDCLEHDLVDKKELAEMIEGCAEQSEYTYHEFMWRNLKRMIDQHEGTNVIGFSKDLRGPDNEGNSL